MAENTAKEGFEGVVQNTPFIAFAKANIYLINHDFRIYIMKTTIFIEIITIFAFIL